MLRMRGIKAGSGGGSDNENGKKMEKESRDRGKVTENNYEQR